MTYEKMKRVTRSRPCPVCGRPDWCLYAGPDDDPEAAICPRVESPKRCGDAGWLHRLRDRVRAWSRKLVRRVPLDYGPRPDFAKLAEGYRRCFDPERLARFAKSLGLNPHTLERFGVGWSLAYSAWSFPMRDADGSVVGIRLRKPDGSKFAVKGSREGLFLPWPMAGAGTLLVAEGATDPAALFEMGFHLVAGRPSCGTGVGAVVGLARRLKPPGAVVVADGDEPGRRGAERLASELVAYAEEVRVIAPPAGVKDARDWLRSGGTRADVERAIAGSPARRLGVRLVGGQGGSHAN